MRNIIIYTFILFLGVSQLTKAQVGIGTNAPNASSMLDVYSKDKGMLFPSYSLPSLTDPTNPILNPADGLIIYNTGGTYSKGLYYWYINSWNKMFLNSDLPGGMTLSTLANPNLTASSLLISKTSTTNNKITTLGLVSTQINGSSYDAANSTVTLPKGKYKVEFSVDVIDNTGGIYNSATAVNPTPQLMFFVSLNNYLKDTAGNILGQASYDNEIITGFFATYYVCFYIDLSATTTFSLYMDYGPDSARTDLRQRTSAELQIAELKDL